PAVMWAQARRHPRLERARVEHRVAARARRAAEDGEAEEAMWDPRRAPGAVLERDHRPPAAVVKRERADGEAHHHLAVAREGLVPLERDRRRRGDRGQEKREREAQE